MEHGPGQEAGTPGEAAAEGGQRKPVAGPDRATDGHVGEGERDGGGAGVADGLDEGRRAVRGAGREVRQQERAGGAGIRALVLPGAMGS